jgi:hypothetical protein
MSSGFAGHYINGKLEPSTYVRSKRTQLLIDYNKSKSPLPANTISAFNEIKELIATNSENVISIMEKYNSLVNKIDKVTYEFIKIKDTACCSIILGSQLSDQIESKMSNNLKFKVDMAEINWKPSQNAPQIQQCFYDVSHKLVQIATKVPYDTERLETALGFLEDIHNIIYDFSTVIQYPSHMDYE